MRKRVVVEKGLFTFVGSLVAFLSLGIGANIQTTLTNLYISMMAGIPKDKYNFQYERGKLEDGCLSLY